MLEMYVQELSTRKVSKVIKNMYGKKYSKSFVLSLIKALDEEVKLWRNSDLSGSKYPYIKACHIAIGINEKGNREITDLDLSASKSVNTHSQTSFNI